MALFNKKNRYLGIDISATAVKLVELSRAGGRFQVEAYGTEPLPEGTMDNRNPSDPAAVGAAIRKIVKDCRTSLREAVVAVPSTSVITRTITMPIELGDAEIESTLQLEASQYIPFALEEVYLDFEVVGRSALEPTQQDVLLVATRREYVDLRNESLREAGLRAAIVDVETYALENSFHLLASTLPQYGADARFALIDVGAGHTTLYVLQEGRTIYTREHAFGGDMLTNAIADAYGITRADAELAKRTGGQNDEYSTDLITHYRNTIAEQIGQTLQFFFSSSHHSTVEHVILTGGGSLVPGLPRAVGATLQIPTVLGNPFEAMTAPARVRHRDLQAQAPLYATACGLALRSFDR